jgi:hypothetical protein
MCTLVLLELKLKYLKSSRFKNIIDAEVAWKMFLEEREGLTAALSGNTARYIRINPEMDTIPELDDTHSLGELQFVTSKSISEETIRDVALRLVASSFYFKKLGCSTVNTGAGYDCHGNEHPTQTRLFSHGARTDLLSI